MPDWNLSSVISIKERKAIKEEKGKDKGKQQNESKRVWMIGSAVVGVGILLATIFHLTQSHIFAVNDSIKVDDIICEIPGIKFIRKDSVCLLSKSELDLLCRMFVSTETKCEPQNIADPLREIRLVRGDFVFSEFEDKSRGDGIFSSALVLQDSAEVENVAILEQELFGGNEGGRRDIKFDEYLNILKYQKKVKFAWQSLKELNADLVFKNKNQSVSGLWSASDYNNALLDIRSFLGDLPEKINSDDLAVLSARKFIDVECFSAVANKNTTISSCLKNNCFKEGHPEWQELKSSKGNQPSSKYKAITLFENILDLKSPLSQL